MALSSASTDAAVKAALEDNADYDLAASATKAREFVHACRIRLHRMYSEVQSGAGHRLAEEYRRIEAMLAKAEAWLAAHDATASTAATDNVRFRDLSYLRD